MSNQFVTAQPERTRRALSSDICFASDVRTIRLESTTGEQIQMFEFNAFTPSGDEVAVGKTSSQSSTLFSKPKFLPNNAIDGSLDSFSHTNDSSPWWEVDLEQDQHISSVIIHNRYCKDPSDSQGCLCRMSHATLSLLDVEGNIVASIDTGNTCAQQRLEYDFSLCNDVSSANSGILVFLYHHLYFAAHKLLTHLLCSFTVKQLPCPVSQSFIQFMCR